MPIVKRLILSNILLLIFLSGCVFSSTYLNREEDKNAAMEVIGKFYYYTGIKDYEHVYGLFGKEFYKVTPKNKLKDLFLITQNKLGERKDTNIGDWETKRVEGTNPSAEYKLQYDNVYTNAEAHETFYLMKESDGQIRITGYRIMSDKLK